MTIEITHASVGFGAVTALDDVSMSSVAGELVVVIGPNAAGKSTLLRTMAGLQALDGGEIRLEGREIQRLEVRERARRLCYLPQVPDVVGGFSVADVVGFGRVAWSGDRQGSGAVGRALEMVGLAGETERRYHDLSVGQRQRASLARAILQLQARERGWMLLDEPFSAQDPGEASRLARLLVELRDRGHGLCIVLHDPSIAWILADRVVMLDRGRVLADGPREEILHPDRLREIYGVEFRMGPFGPVPMLVGSSA